MFFEGGIDGADYEVVFARIAVPMSRIDTASAMKLDRPIATTTRLPAPPAKLCKQLSRNLIHCIEVGQHLSMKQ